MIDLNRIKKIMLDTAPLIFFIEEHKKYFPLIKSLFDKIDSHEIDAIRAESMAQSA